MTDLQSTDDLGQEAMLSRLQQTITDFDFDDTQCPYRSSYGSWHFMGKARNIVHTPAPTGYACMLGEALHPCLDIQHAEHDESYNFSGDTSSVIVAQVSRHIMRLEREYKLADMLYRERTIGSHKFIRPLRFVHLCKTDDQQPLAAMLIAAPSNTYLADMDFLIPRTKPSKRETSNLTVHVFLQFAIRACECMETFHYRHGLIHGEIRPDTFFFDRQTSTVRILNSGCGVRSIGQCPGGTGLDQSNRDTQDSSVGYYAPEQTGRIGAGSDLRTDIYSLGITFWSILLDQHAFSGKDAAQTLQNMLFKKLHSVSSQRPEVPAAISAIIGKMIKRSSKERYASVTLIKNDLQKVQQYLMNGDSIALANFKVSDIETTCIFKLPKQIIGRESEQTTIRQAMDKVLHQLSQSLNESQNQLGVLNSPSVSDSESEKDVDDASSDSSFDDTCAGPTTEDSLRTKKPVQKTPIKSGTITMAEVMKRSVISQTLHARELGNKYQVAQQLRRGGKVEVLSVIAPTGRGKTRLIRHLRDSTREFCYMAYAKFDRTKDRPFEALFQLLSSLLLQIFSERDCETMFHQTLQEYIAPHFEDLRNHLHLAEMSADSLLGSFKPVHATTLGTLDARHPPPPTCKTPTTEDDHTAAQSMLEAGSSNNSPRFVHILLEIFRLMAVQKLVTLVLDDLSYADTESLEFVHSLVETSVPLLIIVTTQTAAGDSVFADRLINSSTPVFLDNLSTEETEEYVAMTIGRSVEYCVPLAALTAEHTRGNPSLVGDFLDQCYRTRGLYYCWNCAQWEFKLRPLMKHFSSLSMKQSDSNALLHRHFSKLSTTTQLTLQWAAVIGYSFSYQLLKDVTSSSTIDEDNHAQDRIDDTLCALQAAISRQIIRSSENADSYRFTDDNYYQAASLRNDKAQKTKMSYAVACAMLRYRQDGRLQGNVDLFDHARQIMLSKDIALEKAEHIGSFCKVLTQAAETSRDSGALTKAADLFKHAVHFLHADNSRISRRDGLMLQVKAAESLALINRHETALGLLQDVGSYTESRTDKALVAIVRSRAYSAKGDHDKAYETLKDEVDLEPLQLGAPSLSQCDNNFWIITKQCLKTSHHHQSKATDEHKALASLLIEMLSTLFWRDEARAYQTALLLVQMHNEYGMLTGAALGLVHLGAVAMYRFSDPGHALALRQYAARLLKGVDETYLLCRMSTTRVLLLDHLEQNVQGVIRSLLSSTEASASAGDQGLHLLNLAVLASMRLEQSDDLAQIETYIERSVVELTNWQMDTKGGVILTSIYQCVRALQGKTNTSTPHQILDDSKHSTNKFLQALDQHDGESEVAWAAYTASQVMALFMYGYNDQVFDKGTEMLPVLQGYRRLPSSYRTFCYTSLAIAQRLRKHPKSGDAEEMLELFDALKAEIQAAASSKASLHTIWVHLLAAEDPVQRDNVNDQQRAASYDQAIQIASQSRLSLEEGLCLELYARFQLARNCVFTAIHLLNLSISAYSHISAIGKVEHLRTNFRTLLKDERLPKMVLPVPKLDEDATEHTSSSEYSFFPPNTARRRDTQHEEAKDSSGSNTPIRFDYRAPSSAHGLDMLDLQAILQGSQQLSSELDLKRLFDRLTQVLLGATNAEACAVAAESEEEHDWAIVASSAVEGIRKPTAGILLKDSEDWLVRQTFQHVLRNQEDFLVLNILSDNRLDQAPREVLERYPDGQSVLCLPIVYGERTMLGAIYCEAHPKTFSNKLIVLLKLIAVQTSISIFNALLFKKTEKMSATHSSMVQVQKEALAQARQSEKKAKDAEAKSMFLANVSHELRTPLNGIVGMTEILRTTELNEKQLECSASISVCADQLLGIINDILDFSKLEAGKMQAVSLPFKLANTIRETLQTLAMTNKNKDVELKTILEVDDTLVVVTDRVRLSQVFMNLVSNAFKFTTSGSVIVRARVQREDNDRVEVNFAVEDTGIGVPADQVGKLFAPFCQADASTARKYGGTGLGLSICKAIVERIMDGKIWLRSIPGVGTTVAFTIPFKKNPVDSTAQEDTTSCAQNADLAEIQSTLSVRTRKIGVSKEEVYVCIAEDNPINRRIATSYLTKLNISHQAFEDGRQAVDALRLARAEGKPYHIVLMDVQMPVLDGCGATKEIRKHTHESIRDIVIIAMTASAVAGDRERCLEAGMDNYLAKPVRLSALKEMLEQYLK